MIHIDISEGATDQTEKAQALFAVPEKFKPKVSEGAFAFDIKYPDATPYSGNESPVPLDSVRVTVIHHKKKSALPSEYLLREIQPPNGSLYATPWLEETRDGMEVYRYKIDATAMGIYFKFTAVNTPPLLVADHGDWSHAYTIYRKLDSHMELTYLVLKPLIRDSRYFTQDLAAVDNVVLKLVQSFQSK